MGITPALVPIPISAASAIAVCSPDPEVIAEALPIAPACGEQQDRDPRPGPAEVRDRDVAEDRLPRMLVTLARKQDHRGRHQRHELPADEECKRVARADHDAIASRNAAVRPATARPQGVGCR